MKKIFLYILAISFAFTYTSCESDDTAEVSKVTNFASVEALGDAIVYVEMGQPFVEPGVNATIAGEAVDFETIGAPNTAVPGIYDVTYQVVNADGFAARAFRTVYVYENNGSVAGVWDGIRANRGAGGPILVTSTADPNVFNCSDINGGWYEYGVGYGRNFASPAPLTISGSSVLSPGGANGFGHWNVASGAITADQKTMTWTVVYTVSPFSYPVKLTKVTP